MVAWRNSSGEPQAARRDEHALRALIAEVEDGLDSIDFDEVTLEDRRLFLEQAVVRQVRRALRAGRFDLALALQRYGVARLADLERGAWRGAPMLRLVRRENENG